jgi:pimeloyl-ACP methyl ester carboxylesterase
MQRISVLAVCVLPSLALGCGGEVGPQSKPVAEQSAALGSTVTKTKVCFAVTNPGDLTPSWVMGSRFAPTGYTSATTAVVILHGGSSNHTQWQGQPVGSSLAGNPAREIASTGRVVFTFDRLGYPASPYAGDGRTLTGQGYVAMLHQMVTELRTGTYLETLTNCGSVMTPPAIPSLNVVLMGHSVGAGESISYATLFHDVVGLVAIGWSNMGLSNKVGSSFSSVVAPQLAAGADYVYLSRDGASGISDDCLDLLFYLPGADPDVYVQLLLPELEHRPHAGG